MDKRVNRVRRIGGVVRVPGDKSVSHRALILGSMCNGTLPITNLSSAADCRATMTCLRNLGITFDKGSNGTVMVNGAGRFGFRKPENMLEANNSGTTIRLLTGLLAGQHFSSVISGDRSLRRRPMKRIIEPLSTMGAQISGRDGNTRPPLVITGQTLKPTHYTPPVASAQVKSAILIAGLLSNGTTAVVENTPTRDHTERMLAYLGVDINRDRETITVQSDDLHPKAITVPGDISSAFYFLIAGALVDGDGVQVNGVGINPTRLGGLTILEQMGADLRYSEEENCNNEPIGDVEAYHSPLQAITITGDMVPAAIDEIPALVLAATQAEGKTTICGARELRYKESDRLHTTAMELTRMGAEITEQDEGLEIEGPTPLRGTTVDSHHDHRLAMMLSIAALIAEGETVIKNAEAVDVSFPEFFNLLESLVE